MPGFDPRYDYYTGNPDLTASGGAPSTLAGYGPNTRTIMQFQVVAGTATPFNLAALQNTATDCRPPTLRPSPHPSYRNRPTGLPTGRRTPIRSQKSRITP